MAILLKKDTKVLVQGVTGREGSARAAFMKGYGTNVVAGVTPGRGGEEVSGIPVYNTIQEALKAHGSFDLSVTFIPGPSLKDAVLEALDAGIKLLVMPVERVPLYDILEMMAHGKQKGARLVGPGSIGITTHQFLEPETIEQVVDLALIGHHVALARRIDLRAIEQDVDALVARLREIITAVISGRRTLRQAPRVKIHRAPNDGQSGSKS